MLEILFINSSNKDATNLLQDFISSALPLIEVEDIHLKCVIEETHSTAVENILKTKDSYYSWDYQWGVLRYTTEYVMESSSDDIVIVAKEAQNINNKYWESLTTTSNKLWVDTENYTYHFKRNEFLKYFPCFPREDTKNSYRALHDSILRGILSCNINVFDVTQQNTLKPNDKVFSFTDSLLTQRKKDPRYKKRIIYIDGGLGDHITAIPYLRTQQEYLLCARSPQIFKNQLDLFDDQFIDWNDFLFGSGCGNSYLGSVTNSLKKAWFHINGEPVPKLVEEYKWFYIPSETIINNTNKVHGQKYILLAPYSAGENKHWKHIYWKKVALEVRSLGYKVIIINSSSDDWSSWNASDGLYAQFSDLPTEELGALIKNSALTITVDSYIQHLGAAVGGNILCITPAHNQHAYHKNNMYISGDTYTSPNITTWNTDTELVGRNDSMSSISPERVLRNLKIFFLNNSPPRLLGTPKTNRFLIFITAYNDPLMLGITLASLAGNIAYESQINKDLEFKIIVFDNSERKELKERNRLTCEEISSDIQIQYLDSEYYLPPMFNPGGILEEATNWGQRGSINYLRYSDEINHYDYILIYDQDQITNMPLSYFKKALDYYPEILTVSGYRKQEEGCYTPLNYEGPLKLTEDEAEGCVCFRTVDFIKIFPIPMFDYIDPQYGGDCVYGSSPPIGVGWWIYFWSPFRQLWPKECNLRIEGGVEHIGLNSKWNTNLDISTFSKNDLANKPLFATLKEQGLLNELIFTED